MIPEQAVETYPPTNPGAVVALTSVIPVAALRAPAGVLPSPSILPLPAPVQTRTTDRSATIRLLARRRSPPPAVGPFLAGALAERWKTYRQELRRCQEEFSEEAVHELRVATRRLLAQFVLLGCVMPGAGLERARRILKGRLAALGDLRDTQVQLGFLDEQAERFPEVEPLRRWLGHREQRLAKTAARKVLCFKTKKLGRWLTAMAEDLAASAAQPGPRKRLASAVIRAASNAFAETLQRRQAIDPADRHTIHQTRIAFKRFRYMMESLSPGLTGLSKRQLRALAYYQRRMGIIQDLEVMQRCVVEYVADHRKAKAALRPFYRYLRGRQRRALQSFLASADQLSGFWPPARLAAGSDAHRVLRSE